MKITKQVRKYGLVIIAIALVVSTIGYSVALSNLTTENGKDLEKEKTGEEQNESSESIILEFFEGCCDPESVDPWNESQLGMKKITWLDNSTVTIQAYVSINCAFWIEGGGFHIHNNTITLTYFVGRTLFGEGILMANCICSASISFSLSNLDSEEYTFELEPIYTDYPSE